MKCDYEFVTDRDHALLRYIDNYVLHSSKDHMNSKPVVVHAEAAFARGWTYVTMYNARHVY